MIANKTIRPAGVNLKQIRATGVPQPSRSELAQPTDAGSQQVCDAYIAAMADAIFAANVAQMDDETRRKARPSQGIKAIAGGTQRRGVSVEAKQ